MGSTKARGASKVEHREFTEKARKLSDKPELLLPLCAHKEKKCGKCPFDKLGEQLGSVQRHKDDKGKLDSASKWAWNKFARAYAGLLLIRHDGDKNLYLLVAKYPAGSVGYILKGKAPKEKLIGVQHYDNPKWRLMAYMDFAKKGFYFYSAKDRLYCSGHDPLPPAQFIKEAVGRSRYQFKSEDGRYRCIHLAQNEDSSYLKLTWKSPKIVFEICEKCCSEDENLFCKLTEMALSREQADDFGVKAKFRLACKAKCGECALDDVVLDPVLAERYLSGSLSDKQLVTEYLDDVRKGLENRGRGGLFVAAGECYGSDIKGFISALNPGVEERIALERVLKDIDRPILIDSPTPSKVLSLLWDEHGLDAVESVVDDKELAKEIYEKHTGEQPSQTLKDAWLTRREREILAELPEYYSLPPVADFANRLARACRAAGPKECLQVLEKAEKKDMKMKSVAYAFLLSLNAQEGKEWQYSKEERDFAQFLTEYVTKLRDSGADGYNDALSNLLTASGAGGEIKKKEKKK